MRDSSNRSFVNRINYERLYLITNDVILVWILEHSGIKGNETTDLLAKVGSTISCIIGPEAALGIPHCLGVGRIRAWLWESHQEFWEDNTRTTYRYTHIQARALIGEPSDRDLARTIRSLCRTDAWLVTQMLTSHGVPNYHMHKLGLRNRKL